MPSSHRRTVFLHVHVRKCGGSTFYNQVLKQNFGSGFIRDSSLIDYRYSPEQVQEILVNCPHLRAYSSHKISLDLPYASDRAEIWAIAWVRDPITRLVSHYLYHRHPAHHWDALAKTLTLDEYLERLIRDDRLQREAQFSQLLQLVGTTGAAGLARLEAFLATGRVLLWPVERFDEGCVCLERRFPNEFRDCRYTDRDNRSAQRATPKAATVTALRDAMDPAELTLWQRARANLDTDIAQIVGDSTAAQQALAEFRHRCRPPVWRRWLTAWSQVTPPGSD